MDDESTKQITVPPSVLNQVLETGSAEHNWNGELIVLTRDDIPPENYEEDCCFRSKNMLDITRGETCCNCGRIFNIYNELVGFDDSYTEQVVINVSHSEFLTDET